MNNQIILWAESPEEARIFLARARRQSFAHRIDLIYVAKRSAKNRANKYVEGEYFCTSNDDAVTLYDDVIIAPQSIIALVQWCTCDVMVSRGAEPLFVLEDTTHMVRMNVYQRIPRLFKAAMLGVPALALQGTRGLDFTKRGDCWGLHRYMRAFAAISRSIPETPVLPFFYVPTDPNNDELLAETAAFQYIDCLVRGDIESANSLKNSLLVIISDIEENGYQGQSAPDIQSIEVSPEMVVVNIGAQPDKKSWRQKGSGQMDPYIGMIAAAKYIYCFDRSGVQNKEMVVRFKFIPPDFWWFKDWQESKVCIKLWHLKSQIELSFLDKNIRIDQSHCNYVLSNWLLSMGWEVIFRDPGRASRGHTGNQSSIHGIFVKKSWPIPDIVAVNSGELLLIEIDHRPKVAFDSFQRYRDAYSEILTDTIASGVVPSNVCSLRLGFCKIGVLKKPDQVFAETGLDFLAWFDEPMTPSVKWKR